MSLAQPAAMQTAPPSCEEHRAALHYEQLRRVVAEDGQQSRIGFGKGPDCSADFVHAEHADEFTAAPSERTTARIGSCKAFRQKAVW